MPFYRRARIDRRHAGATVARCGRLAYSVLKITWPSFPTWPSCITTVALRGVSRTVLAVCVQFRLAQPTQHWPSTCSLLLTITHQRRTALSTRTFINQYNVGQVGTADDELIHNDHDVDTGMATMRARATPQPRWARNRESSLNISIWTAVARRRVRTSWSRFRIGWAIQVGLFSPAALACSA